MRQTRSGKPSVHPTGIRKSDLKRQGITVEEAAIDAEVARLRQTPPSAGCSCCTYPSLEAFLTANAYDMAELRETITKELGMDRLITSLWEKEYPAGPARDALVAEERPRIERNFVRFTHIFFNTFQNPDFGTDPETVRLEDRSKAEGVSKRLAEGGDFAAIAREVSEDSNSAPQGGLIGCVPKTMFGDEIRKVLDDLPVGTVSKPVESVYGFHILRWDPLTDEDVLNIVKDVYATRRNMAITEESLGVAAVVRMETDSSPEDDGE